MLVLVLLAAVTVPLRAQAPDAGRAPTGPCTHVVDADGRSRTTRIVWHARTPPRERRALDRHCGALGSIVLAPEPAAAAPDAVDGLAVVSWNVHVGGGDLDGVIDRLESGALTGAPVSDYVLLVQEAYRAGGDVPPPPVHLGVPRRIAPRHATHPRQDIVSLAKRRGLALYYAPSMRNGRDAPFEDRGNAILSTRPLDDVLAVELPFTRQRRVAIAATIRGRTRQGEPWRLRVASVHLDTLAGPSRLWIFADGWRGMQAAAVLAALEPPDPAIAGADLNTWLLGGWERAARRFRASFPQTGTAATPPGAAAHGRLDYLCFRLPAPWTSEVRVLRDRYGSDHAPIVGTIRIVR